MDLVLKIPLSAKNKRRLEKMAKDTSRSTSYLATRANRNYLDQNEWQLPRSRKESRKQTAVNSPAKPM